MQQNTTTVAPSGLVAWMPKGDAAVQRAAAVKVSPGQELTRQAYLGALAQRVGSLIQAEPDPEAALGYVEENLKAANLLADEISLTPQNMATALILDNPEMLERLENLDVTLDLPQTPEASNQQAEQLIQETDLQGWLNSLQA